MKGRRSGRRCLSVRRSVSARSRFGGWPRSTGRRLDLTLQFRQIAAKAIGDLHAQFRELEKLLSELVLPPEEEDGCERSSNGNQPEHYEYEFHSLSRMYLNP